MRLEFDKEGERYYETGIRNVVLYTRDQNNDYTNAEAWNGVTAINENPSGADVTDLYADDIKYLSMRAAENFGLSITAYSYPESFAECDGTKEVAPGVVMGQQSRKSFGLAYITTEGNDVKGNDYGEKLHLVYNATAAPSARNYQTINESPSAIEFSWEISTTPVSNKHGKPSATLTITKTPANATKYNKLLDTLWGTDADPTAQTEGTEGMLPSIDDVVTAMSGQ